MTHWVSVLEVAQVNKGLHYFGVQVPCTVRLAEALYNGRKAFIHGVPKVDAGRFSVNLQNGTSDDADVLLHMDVRFAENAIVLNSRVDGEWGEELRNDNISRFEKNQPFLIEVTASSDGYDVTVNNVHMAVFQFRIAPEKATHMVILGDLRLPGLHFPLEKIPDSSKISIPGNVRLGSVFTLTGYLRPNQQGFSINMQCDESDESDIVFHFNPRFDCERVIRNARIEGQWGEEEAKTEEEIKTETFPFERNKDFGLMIVPRKKTFHVWVNGRKFAAFEHRANMETAGVLTVEGGAIIDDISIDCPPESLPAGSGFEELIFKKNWIQDLYNPPVPVELDVREFKAGNILCISIVIPAGSERFHINFQGEDPPSGQQPDVIFHYNPRMDVRRVVLNTRERGVWQNEVYWEDFPYRERARFEVIVHCSRDGFQVSVNDESPREFPHRTSWNRVRKIVVDGQIQVKRFIYM